MRLTSAATQSNTFCNWRYGLHRNDCAPQAILAMQARHDFTGQLIARHPVGNMPSTSSSRGDDEQMNGGRGQEHPPQIYITIAITRPQTGVGRFGARRPTEKLASLFKQSDAGNGLAD